MRFKGHLDKIGTVTVAGTNAPVDSRTTNFVGFANVTAGTNVIPIVATDYSGNIRSNRYQVVVTNNGVAKTLKYDLNGNLTNVTTTTYTNSYEWDAANRLTAINGPTNRSEFTYDGFGRRVKILEKQNGAPVSTNYYVWCGTALCEQRDKTAGTVTRRFFSGGEQISGTNYFFTRDHLGSIREMTDASGTIQARYDYDPYGRRTKLSGNLDSDFGFTGHYVHAPTGFHLALFRVYDPDTARWLSRDAIDGINLYGYVLNNPINLFDPYGLYGCETKFWADLSVNGSWWQKTVAWPLGVLSAVVPDAVGTSGTFSGGMIGGATFGVHEVYFRGHGLQDYSSFGATKGPQDNPPGFFTPQISLTFSINIAWSSEFCPGAESWTGTFSELNYSEGPLNVSGFASDTWNGIGIGPTMGPVPISASYIPNVDYQYVNKPRK